MKGSERDKRDPDSCRARKIERTHDLIPPCSIRMLISWPSCLIVGRLWCLLEWLWDHLCFYLSLCSFVQFIITLLGSSWSGTTYVMALWLQATESVSYSCKQKNNSSKENKESNRFQGKVVESGFEKDQELRKFMGLGESWWELVSCFFRIPPVKFVSPCLLFCFFSRNNFPQASMLKGKSI